LTQPGRFQYGIAGNDGTCTSVCAELWEDKWGLANEWPMGYRGLMLEPKGGLKVID